MYDEDFFVISSVSRDDLDVAGFDTYDISDETMRTLAAKMSQDYGEQLFLQSLTIIADSLGIPRKTY